MMALGPRLSMWRITGTAALVLCSLVAPAASAEDDPSSGDLVFFPGYLAPHGVPHGEDVPSASQLLGWNIPGRNFKGGDGWWALACAPACALTPVRLGVRATTHPQYDGDPLPSQFLHWSPLPHGLGVAAKGEAQPAPGATLLAIFKPIRGLAASFQPIAGPVKTWLHAGMADAYRPPVGGGTMETLIAMDGGAKAVLMPRFVPAAEGRRTAGEAPPGDLVFELRVEGKRQRLGQYEWDIEGPGTVPGSSYLRWAGDLDGDGRLDLLMSYAARGWHMVLYLSSLAEPDALVGIAGSFRFWPPDDPGC